MDSTKPSATFSRRHFLAGSAASAAALAAPGILKAAPGANDRIRVALIGAGGRGRGVLSTFLDNKDVDCVGLCDVDDAMLNRGLELVSKKRGQKPDTTKDFRRLLERKDVDAVIVGTPDHWHALPTVLACQADKDVYVEKPLANSIDEGRAMVEAGQKHKRVVQMGTQWRSGQHWKEAAEFVQSGKLGKVGLVRAWVHLDWIGDIGNPADGKPPASVDYDLWLGPAPLRPFNPNRFHFNFRWFWDYAGGLMTDWGVHLLNIILWAMGPQPPRSICSIGGKHVLVDNRETPDTQVSVYEFPSYVLMWEHKIGMGVGLNGMPWGIGFSGSEGTLIVADRGWEIIPEPKKKSLAPARHKGGGNPTPEHVRNFLDCMRSRQQPVENLALGHHVTSVAHLGNIALRSGRKITWDAQAERIQGDAEADRLVGNEYRKPWKLPYARRG